MIDGEANEWRESETRWKAAGGSGRERARGGGIKKRARARGAPAAAPAPRRAGLTTQLEYWRAKLGA